MSKLARWIGAAMVPIVGLATALVVATPAEATPATSRVGFIRSDGDLFAKDAGSTLYNGGFSIVDDSKTIKKFAVGGNCLVLLTSTGALFAKTINNIAQGTPYLGGWSQEVASGVSDFAVSSTCLQTILDTGGKIYARYGVGTTWYSQEDSGTVSQIANGGDYQMLRRSDGAVFAKHGNIYTNGGWTLEADAAVDAADIAIAADGLQMYVNGTGETLARSGIGTSWTTEDSASPAVTDIATGGGVQMLLRSDGTVFARSGIGIGGWTAEATSVNQIDASDTGLQVFLTADRKLWGSYSIANSGWTCLDDSLSIRLLSENSSVATITAEQI